jgi:hypothetical protein
MTVPLYRRLLGARFDALPPRVAELHDVTAVSVWRGRADVERGRSLIVLALAKLLGLPPAGRAQALEVTFTPDGGTELWERRFGEAVFRSLQFERHGLLRERVGWVTLLFALEVSEAGLSLLPRGVRFLGVPLPPLLVPKVRTMESERDGRYRFEVEGSLPLVGLLVRYEGWLEHG